MAQKLLAALSIAVTASPAWSETNAELEFARYLLTNLQTPSFLENVEYCGYIGLNDAGDLVATEATRGGPDWCEMDFPESFEVMASYHTHAGYDPNAWSEIPSGADMESDEDLGIDGYVSTPGGRFWYIDTEDMVTTQICGIGCLPMDVNFKREPEDNIQKSYTYDELVTKIGE